MLKAPTDSPGAMPDGSQTAQSNIEKHTFYVEGMTCAGCEESVKHAVNQLDGILDVIPSYENKNTEVKFDNTKTLIIH